MKRLSLAISFVALVGLVAGSQGAVGSNIPVISICFSYHNNASVETFAVPNGTHCPSGYTYGAGTVANTAQLITILNSVSKNNYRNGTAYGKAVVRKCIKSKNPSFPIRALKC
jgi:hypothetical protein